MSTLTKDKQAFHFHIRSYLFYQQNGIRKITRIVFPLIIVQFPVIAYWQADVRETYWPLGQIPDLRHTVVIQVIEKERNCEIAP